MVPKSLPSILILTTHDPTTIKAAWPYYQNWTLPQKLREHGAQVTLRCWRDESLTASSLAPFDTVTFLWCNNYHEHPTEFPRFVREVLQPAQRQPRKPRRDLRVINSCELVLWNTDKAIYLDELHAAGFLVPRSEFVGDLGRFRSVEGLAAFIAGTDVAKDCAGTGAGLVLKPSISGSSKQTYRLNGPLDIPKNASDVAFLDEILATGVSGSLVLQTYEPAISRGEFSLVFIDGRHTHTMLKTPCPGEFRCQAEFGGSIAELQENEVPVEVKQVAEQIMRYLIDRFGRVVYCRIDGVVRRDDNGEDGKFVLMEVEAIEPHLWLETAADDVTREIVYNALLDRSG